MNTKTIAIGIIGLMAMAAFVGVIQPVMAAESVVSPTNTGDHTALAFFDSDDGTQICDGPGMGSDSATPYGNATMFEVGESPLDIARTPEQYGGYAIDATNGHSSDAGYYVFTNFGVRMGDWFPATGYYLVSEIGPAAWGGHHPTATQNYTAAALAPNWDEEPEIIPTSTFHAICPTFAAADNAGAARLTWTDMVDENSCIIGYRIFKSVNGGAWTVLSDTVAEGVGSYTDVAGSYVAANRYTIQPRFPASYRVYGKSPIASCGVVVNTAPVSAAGVDQSVNEDVLVTFNGAGSTDLEDGTPTTYTWTFTDGVLRTLTGVAPTYTFATPGVYTVTLDVADSEGLHDATPDTMTVTVADVTPIVISNPTPAAIAPDTAFALTCDASDYVTLTIGMVELYYVDTYAVTHGPVAANSFLSAGNNQITKADVGNEPMTTGTYSWNIPVQVLGEVHYWFATDDGTNAALYPVGANAAGPYLTINVAAAGNQPHPLVGYVVDPLGLGLNGATVVAEWNGTWTATVVTANDGLGNAGWFQIDIDPSSWTVGQPLYVNATYLIYAGTNVTFFALGDNILPDDDKEYVNVTIIMADLFELKWTLGWNIWSIPMLWDALLGLPALQFSWFANEHWKDTSKVGIGDEAVLVAFNAGAYTTYIYPVDNGTGNDVVVNADGGYWAFVGESWFTDETPATEVGIFVPGVYVWRVDVTRNVPVAIGWNLLGWTSFNFNYTATDVIWTLTSAAVSGDGVPQPEIIANWTADAWETGTTADMVHYEGLKGYTTFVSLGAYGQSLPVHDFPVGPGYGFWVYSEVGGQTLTYLTQ